MEWLATIAAACVAALASVVSALIAVRGERKAAEAEAAQARFHEERRERERESEYVEEATAQGMLAVLEAVDVSLIALQGGHLDGNVDSARDGIKEARAAYQRTRSRALSRLL